MWTINKIVKKGAYLYAVVKEHPKATKRGYVLHHRIVMENFLGRLLTGNEVVHHIDENKHNNEITNLKVMSKKEHCKHHATKGRTWVYLICPNCGITFLKEKRQIKPKTIPKCSRKCNGAYSRKLQLNRVQTSQVAGSSPVWSANKE